MSRFVRRWIPLIVASVLFVSYGLITIINDSSTRPPQKMVTRFNSSKHGKYCVVYNYRKAENTTSFNYEPITLAIHSTPHYLHLLPSQVTTINKL